MAETGVFLVANLSVRDADRYRQYEKGFFPILEKHGGTFVTFDDESVTLEGQSPPKGRLVLFRFPSEAAARAWYGDPEYQTLSEHRRAGSDLHFLTMIHEMPPRG